MLNFVFYGFLYNEFMMIGYGNCVEVFFFVGF